MAPLGTLDDPGSGIPTEVIATAGGPVVQLGYDRPRYLILENRKLVPAVPGRIGTSADVASGPDFCLRNTDWTGPINPMHRRSPDSLVGSIHIMTRHPGHAVHVRSGLRSPARGGEHDSALRTVWTWSKTCVLTRPILHDEKLRHWSSIGREAPR